MSIQPMLPEEDESGEDRDSILHNEHFLDARSLSRAHSQLTTLEIFANPMSRSGPTILNPSQGAVLIKTVAIKKSCYLLLNHSDGRTKVVTTKKAMPRKEDKFKGYEVIAQVNIPESVQSKLHQEDASFSGAGYNFQLQAGKDVETGKQRPFDQNDVSRNVFVSLRKEMHQNSKWYELQPNDILKFGRQVYRFKIIQGKSKKNIENTNESTQFYNLENYPYAPLDLAPGNCKICLSNEENEVDPIISPCSCTGSCGDVHLQCLRMWMDNKVLIRSNANVRTYNLQKFQCQICKTVLPSKYYFNGSYLHLTPESINSKWRFQLEQIATGDSHLMHCIEILQGQEIDLKIGRGGENHIILDDMSVSRMHAVLRIKKNKVWLEDKSSKFGTFVHLKENFKGNEAVLLSNRISFNFKSSIESLTDCEQ